MQSVRLTNIVRKVIVMCGRYYIESGWEGEIEDVVQDIDRRIRQEQFIGDVHPTDLAPVIEMENQRLKLNICRWGYSLSKGKNLVINARVESVLDKPSFKNGIQYHRILIPASGFYERNQLKEKMYFPGMMHQYCIWLASVIGLRMNDDL